MLVKGESGILACSYQALGDEVEAAKVATYQEKFLKDLSLWFGSPAAMFTPWATSLFRCSEYNRKIGGSIKSFHTLGRAADFPVRSITFFLMGTDFQASREKMGKRGIFRYYYFEVEGYLFVHIDDGMRGL